MSFGTEDHLAGRLNYFCAIFVPGLLEWKNPRSCVNRQVLDSMGWTLTGSSCKRSGSEGAFLAFNPRKSRDVTGDRLSVPGGIKIAIGSIIVNGTIAAVE